MRKLTDEEAAAVALMFGCPDLLTARERIRKEADDHFELMIRNCNALYRSWEPIHPRRSA